MQFIQTRPAVILLGPNGSEIIRKKESWRDIFSLDTIPKGFHQSLMQALKNGLKLHLME